MNRVSTHLYRRLLLGSATAGALAMGCSGPAPVVNRMISSAHETPLSETSRGLEEPSKLSPALQRLADASDTSRDIGTPANPDQVPDYSQVGAPIPGTNDMFQVVIHVLPDVDIKAITAAGAYIQARMGNIIYATVHTRDMMAVAEVVGVIEINAVGGGRIPTPPKGSFGNPPPGAARDLDSGTADAVKFDHQGLTGKGVIVGIIDTGIDWRHPDFIKPDGTSRIKYLWDLFDDTWETSHHTVGTQPPGQWSEGKPMGTLYTHEQINMALKGQIQIPRTDKIGHGTACAGTATGNGLGVAPDAELVVADTYFEGGDNAENDGTGSPIVAKWIREMAASEHKPCVMSLSFGASLNPHDGTGDWEDAFNEIVDHGKAPGVVICASAGNDGENSMHARARFAPAEEAQLYGGISEPIELNVSKKTTIAAYFDSKDDWSLIVDGRDKFLFGQDQKFGHIKIYKKTIAAKDRRDLAVAGSDNLTADDQAKVKSMFNTKAFDIEALPNGTDEVVLDLLPGSYYILGGGHSKHVTKGVFDLYLPNPGSASFGMGGDHKMVVGSPGDADGIITVGSYDCCNQWDNVNGTKTYSGQVNLGNISGFSSAGFRRDGVVKPDIAAPGDYIISAFADKSTLAEGDVTVTKDGKHVAWRGTSAACPYTAGVVALMLQKNPQLTADQTKQILRDSADHDLSVTGAVPNGEWGYGKLNGEKALTAVPAGVAIAPTPEPTPGITPAPSVQPGFAGTFKGDDMLIKLVTAADGSFTGEMTRGRKTFPLTAKAAAGELQGTAVNNGNDFSFTAEVEGNKLTLQANGKTFVLSRLAD